MLKYLLRAITAGALLFSGTTLAQIQPSGPFTRGHTVQVLNSAGTAVGDAGGAAGSTKSGTGYLTELGITNTGTPFCINDALINAAGGYHQLCLGANTLGGGLISYNAYGGAAALPLSLNLNGTNYQFPFALSGVVGPNPSTIGYAAIFANNTGTLLGQAPVRTALTQTTNFYVNANPSASAVCGPSGNLNCAAGSDSNSGASPNFPWLTLQHAFNVISSSVDTAGNTVTVNLAHGSSSNYAAACAQGGPWIGTSVIQVSGDSTAITAVTIVDQALGYGLQVKDGCTLQINNFAFADAASHNAAGHIIVGGSGNAGHLDYSNITLGSLTTGTQMQAGFMGSISAVGTLFVTGGAPNMLEVSGSGTIQFDVNNVNIPSALAYSLAVGVMLDSGQIIATPSTFTGSGVSGTTGPKCLVSGVANMGGYDPNGVFPGSTNCTPNTVIGGLQFKPNPNVFANLLTCNSFQEGAVALVTDSSTVTWGAIITGGSTNAVLAFCDGFNWTVMAK